MCAHLQSVDFLFPIICYRTSSDSSDSSTSSSGSKALQCAICIMDYETGDVIKELPCGHEFHSDCIDKWLPLKKICPLCRHDITKPSDSGFAAPSAMHRQNSTGSSASLPSSPALGPNGSGDIEDPLLSAEVAADSRPMSSAANT